MWNWLFPTGWINRSVWIAKDEKISHTKTMWYKELMYTLQWCSSIDIDWYQVINDDIELNIRIIDNYWEVTNIHLYCLWQKNKDIPYLYLVNDWKKHYIELDNELYKKIKILYSQNWENSDLYTCLYLKIANFTSWITERSENILETQ